MNTEDSPINALAIAISGFAAIALFWAVVLAVIITGNGNALLGLSGEKLKITDVTGGITALCALLVAAYSLWTARRHNRLSVRPLPWISLGDFQNSLTVSIHNNGIGPMIIDRVVVRGPGVEKSNLIECMPSGIIWRTFVSVFEGRSIGKDKDIMALQLEGDSKDPSFVKIRDRCRAVLGELVLEVHYRDAYERKMPPAIRSLEWFKRNL